MSSHRIMLWLGVILGALAFAACSAESDPPPAAKILSFQSSPADIEAGRAATLSWQTQHAHRVEIVEVGGQALAVGDEPASRGSIQVVPTQTTSYELRAYGKSSAVATQVAVVGVVPGTQAPVVVSFTAEPDHVTPGEELTLSWITAESETVRIVDAAGASVTVARGEAATRGQLRLKPRGSSTYHLVATGPGGQSEAEVAVTVEGLPTVTLSAPSVAIEPGGFASLGWTATLAERVIIVDDSGSVVYDGADLTGSVQVQPTFTTTYTATARGKGNEGMARVTIAVRPVIELFEARASGPVYPGDLVDVQWTVRGARELSILRLGQEAWIAPEQMLSHGSVRLPAGVDGAFRLRARSGTNAVEEFASVSMHPVPRIVEMDISPREVTADETYASDVTVSWLIDAANRIEIETDAGQTINVYGRSPRMDSVTVPIQGPTRFRLSAFNDDGVTVAEREIVPHRVAKVDSFVALPAVARVGESITLFWETQDGATVSIEKVGEGIIATGLPGATGSFSDVVTDASSYILRVYNPVGYETVSDPASVEIGDQSIERFVADRFYVSPGMPVTLSWTNVGGQDLQVTTASGTVVLDVDGNPCATTDLFRIAEGSCVIPGPDVGEHTFTLTLRSGLASAPEAVAHVEMESVTGPVITSFEIEGGVNTVGRPVTFRWETTEDIAGNGALIELSAGGEVFFSTTTPALSGSATHAFDTHGVFPVTIRSHSPEGEHRLSRQLDIRGVPVIAAFSATPTELDALDGITETTFSWSAEHGRLARIHKVGANGLPIEPPVLTVPSIADGVGTASLEPGSGAHEFALVVDNGAGATAMARGVHVVADRARASLTLSQADFTQDGTVTVTWETHNADHVYVMPSVLTATNLHTAREIGTRFVDISNLPNVVEHPRTAGTEDSGHFDITFPAGFQFPFDGKPRTSARAWVDGVVSFNMDSSATGGSGNTRLPSTGSTAIRAHMAIFWDDLHVARDGQPSTKLLSAVSEDESGPFFAIQWTGSHPWSTSAHPADLNFQVILRPNGSFEYRYGKMVTANNVNQGTGATIGFQNYTGTVGWTLSHDTAVPGGLANRSWLFEPGPSAPSGSMTVNVTEHIDFGVWARNSYSEASDHARASRWRTPTLVASVSPDVTIGEDFDVRWSSTEANRIEVFNEANVLLCSHNNPRAIPENASCAARVDTEGTHVLRVRATAGVPSNFVERTITVRAYQPLRVTLSADDGGRLLNPGESIRLSWETFGATSYALTANGVDIPVPQTATGNIVLSPAVPTTYVFTVKNTPGASLPPRVVTADHFVRVRSNRIDSLEAQAGSTLVWATTGATHVYVDGYYAVQEIPGPSRFVDIRSSPTVRTSPRIGTEDEGGYVFTLPEDFEFHFDGERVTTLTASTNGWITLSETTSGWVHSNTALPGTGDAAKIHLAPFWDDLNVTGGGVYLDVRVDPEFGRHVLIQWATRIHSPADGSLNFQVALYEDGRFEYRYGGMTNSGTGRAAGSSATVGYQSRTRDYSQTILFDTAAPGGLQGKNFLFNNRLPANGSQEIKFGTPGPRDIVLCSSDGYYEECEVVTVNPVVPNDLVITEVMANPTGGLDGQWIELRNVGKYAVDLKGATLESGTTTHSINGSVVLQPGEFAVLSRGGEAVNGGIGADYVYGNSLQLGVTTGNVNLKFGSVVVHAVNWDGTWSFPSGQSLNLDPSYHVPAGGNAVRARWCTSTEPLANGDRGSPGYPGTSCRLARYKMDWFSDRPFIDIAQSGTAIPKINDNDTYLAAAEAQNIGFAFPFFDSVVTQWWGSSNGFISFTALTSSSFTNSATWPNNSTPNNLVAVFWDDLNSQTGSSVRTQLVAVDNLQVRIIQWTRFAVLSNTGTITFQIQLWENGDIVLAYKDITAASDAALLRYLGSSVSIGIENADASAGAAFMINQPWIFDGRVLAFERR